MRKPLIIAHCPPRRGMVPPEGDSWLRLARVLWPEAGESDDRLRSRLAEAFHLWNLFIGPRKFKNQKNPWGGGLSSRAATWNRLYNHIAQLTLRGGAPSAIVLLGQDVAREMRAEAERVLGRGPRRELFRVEPRWKTICVPHPSGRNLLLNSESVRNEMREKILGILDLPCP